MREVTRNEMVNYLVTTRGRTRDAATKTVDQMIAGGLLKQVTGTDKFTASALGSAVHNATR